MSTTADIDPANGGQPSGSAHGGANGPGVAGAAQPGGGTGDADEIAQRIKAAEQRGFDTAWGKLKQKQEQAVQKAAEEAVARTRQETLAELGFSSPEELEAWKTQRAEAEAKRPEAERKARANEAAIKAGERKLKEATDAITQRDAALAEQGERFFSMYRRGLAAEIIAKGGLHGSARADLDAYLDGHTVTEEGGRLVLKDDELEIELDPDEGATDLTKIIAHLGKTRGHWFAPAVVQSGAGPMRRPSAPGIAAPQPTIREQAINGIVENIEQRIRR